MLLHLLAQYSSKRISIIIIIVIVINIIIDIYTDDSM